MVNSPERCFEVGGNADGHHYFISSDSGEIYVWWHDPDEITRLDVTPFSMEELIEWSLQRGPAYPSGRNWSTFQKTHFSMKLEAKDGGGTILRIQPTRSLVFGHPLGYPFIRIRERMAVFGDFEVQFESEQVLALLQPHHGFLVEVRHRQRGRRCQIDLTANEALMSNATFVGHSRELDAWLRAEGFCDVDDPAVMMPEE